jgi:hypothetical protein
MKFEAISETTMSERVLTDFGMFTRCCPRRKSAVSCNAAPTLLNDSVFMLGLDWHQASGH